MKDEIKEILEDVKRHLDYVEATKQCSIRDNEMKVMYDYITNLQEENKELKEKTTKLYKQDTKIIKDLKEELETTQEKWNKDKQFDKCRMKELIDYKSRIEKAVEYIDNLREESAERQEFYDCYPDDLYIANIEVLLNILKGEDK